MSVKCPKCNSDNPDTQSFCGDCGTKLYLDDDIQASVTKTIITPVSGSILAGKYRILEKLGEGGMGVVYKAEDLKLKRSVAIKFLPPELTKDKEARERFVREAQAAAALSHPNICTVYEIDEDKDKSFIVMECVEGESLREKLKSDALKLDEALDIAIQVAEGLEKAHAKGIVHRDIKSANIMVTETGQAKIMDFGLAKVTGASLITKEAMTMGTVSYMSPEQAKGEVVDHRTDIWSLGVVLYEMLSGQFPFPGENDPTVIYTIIHTEPRHVCDMRNDIPATLDQIIGKTLEKNPDERYQTVKALIDDMRAVTQGVELKKIRTRPAEAKVLGMKKVNFYAGVAISMIVLSLAIFLLVRPSPQSYESIAVLPLENLSGNPELEWFSDGITEGLIGELAQISALRVISRTSVMMYKGLHKPMKEIARELDVDAVVEGSIIREEDRVRINVQLIDAKEDRHLWADKYDREYRNILILQDEVAQAIAEEVRVKVKSHEKTRLERIVPINTEAHDAYLRGLYSMNQFTPESLERSIENFEKAIAVDPEYAQAYSGLAYACVMNGIGHGAQLPQDALPRARAAALKALKYDDALSDAHISLALTEIYYFWDWRKAEDECRLGIELNPNNATAYNSYYTYLGVMGRYEEALAAITQAKQLDPLSLIINADFGVALILLRRYEEAIRHLKEMLQVNMTAPGVQWALGEAFRRQGMYDEAVVWFTKAFNSSGEHGSWLGPLGRAYAEEGKEIQARDMLEKLKELCSGKYNVSLTEIAAIHEALGEKDQALEWLEKAIDGHDPQAPFYKFYNIFKSMRSDPRFKAIVKRINLE